MHAKRCVGKWKDEKTQDRKSETAEKSPVSRPSTATVHICREKPLLKTSALSHDNTSKLRRTASAYSEFLCIYPRIFTRVLLVPAAFSSVRGLIPETGSSRSHSFLGLPSSPPEARRLLASLLLELTRSILVFWGTGELLLCNAGCVTALLPGSVRLNRLASQLRGLRGGLYVLVSLSPAVLLSFVLLR